METFLFLIFTLPMKSETKNRHRYISTSFVYSLGKWASLCKGFPSHAKNITNQLDSETEELREFKAFAIAATADHAEFVVFDRKVSRLKRT